MKSGIVVLFALASFLAALLSFSAQPMIGKMALPVFGGTPAVWNTCLVFFQGMLLCGYLLAHGVGPKGFTAPRKVSVQNLVVFAALLVLGYLTLPILVSASSDRWFSPGGYPAFLLLGALCVTASLPLVLVSTDLRPLIQSPGLRSPVIPGPTIRIFSIRQVTRAACWDSWRIRLSSSRTSA